MANSRCTRCASVPGVGEEREAPTQREGGQSARDLGKGCELQTKQERDQEKVTETQRETEGDIYIMRRIYMYISCAHTHTQPGARYHLCRNTEAETGDPEPE